MASSLSHPCFALVVERGLRNFCVSRFTGEADARQAAHASWHSWVLYACHPTHWEELANGGIGVMFGAVGLIRRHVEEKLAPSAAADLSAILPPRHTSQQADLINQKADRIDDPALAAPLHKAVERLEAASGLSQSVKAEPSCSSQSEDERPSLSSVALRRMLSHALAEADELKCSSLLVQMLQQAAKSMAADELMDSMIQLLELEPPSDSEMIRLRALQRAIDEGEAEGMRNGIHAYAVATLWLACLVVRTDRCIAARSRLTSLVLSMHAAQRAELLRLGRKLVETVLPDLIAQLQQLRGGIAKLEAEIGVQEVSVRTAKGISAGLSIAVRASLQ